MKIAFIYGKRPSATLTRLFTSSTCYHVGFTDGTHFWDMHLIRRRRRWQGLYCPAHVILSDSPVAINRDYLEGRLDTDTAVYGVLDYLLFALRPIYHLFGASTRNMGGVICSEMVADDLAACGWDRRFAEVPSPADIEAEILGTIDAINRSPSPLH